MKYKLSILTLFCAAFGNAQPGYNKFSYYYNEQNNNDSTLQYFMSILKSGDKTGGRCFGCAYAAERVGDYYRARQDYEKAIAYYDSAGINYHDSFRQSSTESFGELISKYYKKSLCYAALQMPGKAIVVLSPYIFKNNAAVFFDSTQFTFYEQAVRSVYSKEKIQQQFENAMQDIRQNIVYSGFGDSSEIFYVSCPVRLFGTTVQLAGYSASMEEGSIPERHTRESYIRRFRELEIYLRLMK